MRDGWQLTHAVAQRESDSRHDIFRSELSSFLARIQITQAAPAGAATPAVVNTTRTML